MWSINLALYKFELRDIKNIDWKEKDILTIQTYNEKSIQLQIKDKRVNIMKKLLSSLLTGGDDCLEGQDPDDKNKQEITFLNLKKYTFNVDSHHLLEILTPLTVNDFNKFFFRDNAPYSQKYWMELLGKRKIILQDWTEKEGFYTREFTYNSNSIPIKRYKIQQSYTFSDSIIELDSFYDVSRLGVKSGRLSTKLEVRSTYGGINNSKVLFLLIAKVS